MHEFHVDFRVGTCHILLKTINFANVFTFFVQPIVILKLGSMDGSICATLMLLLPYNNKAESSEFVTKRESKNEKSWLTVDDPSRMRTCAHLNRLAVEAHQTTCVNLLVSA